MGGYLRAIRRRILTPDDSETSVAKRGFHDKNPAATELLESIGINFLRGYGHAVEARTIIDAEEKLEEIPTRFRGFAYEGAGMGLAMLDLIPVGGRNRVARMLDSRGDAHVYMIYVGIGWAMARLPRFMWRNVAAPDPLLRWLVLDGYGFHQAYFKTQRYVRERYQDPAFPWPGPEWSAYANRAIDQGIGRAMWFVCGTDAKLTADTIATFSAERHDDLYAGVGLAATYAGGASEEELRLLRERAGEHRGSLAQGSAFAAECRLRAGLLVPHVNAATEVLCDTTPERAALVCAESLPDEPDREGVPAFEVWRQRIGSALLAPFEPAPPPPTSKAGGVSK